MIRKEWKKMLAIAAAVSMVTTGMPVTNGGPGTAQAAEQTKEGNTEADQNEESKEDAQKPEESKAEESKTEEDKTEESKAEDEKAEESEAETEKSEEAETEKVKESETGTEESAESESESETETETEYGTQTESEAETESETETESLEEYETIILLDDEQSEESKDTATDADAVISFENLKTVIDTCNNSEEAENVSVRLDKDLTMDNDSPLPALSKGSLTIDLNGHSLRGDLAESAIFFVSGGELTITGDGIVENTADDGSVIVQTGGKLNISGGSYKAKKICLDVSNESETTISGGQFSGTEVALRLDKSKVTISDSPVFSSVNKAIYVPEDKSGVELNISGGTFNVDGDNAFGLVCCFESKDSSLKISGGTFNLNVGSGNSLLIGEGVSDTQVSISGGSFNGRIARAIGKDAEWNYTTYYGKDSESGILAPGYVFTDNTFTDMTNKKTEPYVFTTDKVDVVKGSLIKLNTKRSTLENYGDRETATKEKVDLYSVAPVSVGEDGKVYENTDGSEPVIDTDKITNGNVYAFVKWIDADGNEYASVKDYVSSKGNDATGLSAVYKASVKTSLGLQGAMTNNEAVKEIKVEDDIQLNLPITVQESNSLKERTLDLSSHKLTYTSSDAAKPALILNGAWKVKNGAIESSKQACIQANGKTVLDELDCLTTDFKYAVEFSKGAKDSRITSGIFETTQEDGYALKFTEGTQEDITNLFQGTNASCMITYTEDSSIYLKMPKLVVSSTPFTYIANSGKTLDLGSVVYGDSIQTVSQTISNKDYTGDIVITGINTDNSAFVVKEDTSSKKTLAGGSTDTYAYTVTAKEKVEPGDYEGTISIHYKKMDGTTGVFKQKVTMKISKKQLEMADLVVTKTKVYDEKNTAEVKYNGVKGIVSGEDVSISVSATYDTADAGENKTISLKYTMTGKDKDHYLAPSDTTFKDGKITKAQGSATITMSDYHVGESATVKVSSKTNGTKSVTCYYKKKGASDSTYTKTVPKTEGSYTIKVVFAETTNYLAVEQTADYTISYIDTPSNPYTLSGTKGQDGWYSSKVTISPASGYKISKVSSGTYQTSITVEATSSPVIYLKNKTTGAVTKSVQVEKIQIDTKKPTITGIENGKTYTTDKMTCTVSDENLSSVTVDGKAVSIQGTKATVTLQATGEQSVISATDKAGNNTKYTVTLKSESLDEGIIYAGKMKLKKGTVYTFGSGKWKVDNDKTIYNGDMDFYVNADGEFNFQKQ